MQGHRTWYLGFPDQALALAKEAVMLGEDAVNRYQYPITLWYAGHIHMICGELTPAEDLLRKSINLCTERGYPAVRSVSTLLMRLVSA